MVRRSGRRRRVRRQPSLLIEYEVKRADGLTITEVNTLKKVCFTDGGLYQFLYELILQRRRAQFGIIFIARHNKQIIGWCLMRPRKTMASISVYIKPVYRKHGIGKHLVLFATRIALKMGYKPGVYRWNKDAKQFYKTLNHTLANLWGENDYF